MVVVLALMLLLMVVYVVMDADRLGGGHDTGDGGSDAGRSYKQDAADRKRSQRIAADLRDNKI